MCNCSLAGTAACRTCSMNDHFREKNIGKMSESLTQEAWLKLLKGWADGSMTLNRTKTDNKLNTYDLYYGREFFKRITADHYQYDETRDRFYFMKDGAKLANVTGYDLNIVKIN